MIKEKYVDIVKGMGGVNENSIPVYADHNAPNGGQVFDLNGEPLMLENSSESGVHYVVVDPSLLTTVENDKEKFVTFKSNGEPNYIRLWVLDERTGHGIGSYPSGSMWVEYSHLALYVPTSGDLYLPKLRVEKLASGEWKATEIFE